MKIQLISTYYSPETTGNAPYATSLAQGLAASGHDVSAVVAAPHYPGWVTLPRDQWAAREVAGGVRVERVSSYVPSRPTFVTRLGYEILFGIKYARRLDPTADVVLMLSPSLFGSAVARLGVGLMRHRPRTVLWVQDLYSAGVSESQGKAGSLVGRVMRMVEGRILRSFDRVVVIHDRFGLYVTDTLGVPSDRVAVIRNWTHVTPPGQGDRAALRTRYGWTPEQTVVVHAGNMGAKQGLENVVDAARIAQERDLPIRFVLIGDGNQRAVLEERARGIVALQFIDPLPENEFLETLSAADVLLVNERPGLNEAAVPSKLTTYFVTGLPVLAATEPTSTTADEIRASGAGVTVRSGDPAALVEAVLHLREQPDTVSRSAGPDFVRESLSQDAALLSFTGLLTGEPAIEEHEKVGA
ncbi:glycosyltransferase family 4 protein [Raineyella sp.]|uniref:glycosyltransferase family 4 protein n=1 Tax=Raineyella sp. TaxID=1911550 RepID=UPI002B21B151|nr:glycosyltransferase family 4 protein [Raineyella sp.]MEA5153334.1 glycosyltransferase family 4 protein [Raineyella sp.]